MQKKKKLDGVPVAIKVLIEQPKTYKVVPGVQRNSNIYMDNVGFKYYKRNVFYQHHITCV